LFFLENCTQLFGPKFFECRLIAACQLSAKADKFESRFVVISKFRLFIIHGKNPHSLKVERVFNLLALRSLILHNEKEVGLKDHCYPLSPFLAHNLVRRQATEHIQICLSLRRCSAIGDGTRVPGLYLMFLV
jgi:hypothetical protein